MDDSTKIIQKKARYFLDNSIPVHIVKNNGWFHNGNIKEVSDEFLIIDDEKEKDIPIFFLEITDIEKRKKREVEQ